jgi:hypothetical protein
MMRDELTLYSGIDIIFIGVVDNASAGRFRDVNNDGGVRKPAPASIP